MRRELSTIRAAWFLEMPFGGRRFPLGAAVFRYGPVRSAWFCGLSC